MTKEPPGLPKQKPTRTITNITQDIVVNTYVAENPDIVTLFKKWAGYERTEKANECKAIIEQCI